MADTQTTRKPQTAHEWAEAIFGAIRDEGERRECVRIIAECVKEIQAQTWQKAYGQAAIEVSERMDTTRTMIMFEFMKKMNDGPKP